jgi:gliding motility-associated protein GldL
LFALGAIEPQHLKDDWSKVYPELMKKEEDDEFAAGAEDELLPDDGLTASQKLDKMMAEANIGPDLIQGLGRGLEGLKASTDNLNNISDASVATEEYASSLRNASSQVTSLSDTYAKAADSLAGLAGESGNSAVVGEQLDQMTRNLTELNSAYELQLRSTQDSLENTKTYFSGMDEVMSNLSNSASDAKKYADSMSELSKNISSLNNIYGNMLTAMNPNG